MHFKNAFEQQPSLRYVYEKLQFNSALGRQHLLNLPFCTDADTLAAEFDHLEAIITLWRDESLRPVMSHLCQQIHQLNNIAPTLLALENGSYADRLRQAEKALAGDLAAVRKADASVLDVCGELYRLMLAFQG